MKAIAGKYINRLADKLERQKQEMNGELHFSKMDHLPGSAFEDPIRFQVFSKGEMEIEPVNIHDRIYDVISLASRALSKDLEKMRGAELTEDAFREMAHKRVSEYVESEYSAGEKRPKLNWVIEARFMAKFDKVHNSSVRAKP